MTTKALREVRSALRGLERNEIAGPYSTKRIASLTMLSIQTTRKCLYCLWQNTGTVEPVEYPARRYLWRQVRS
jgi:hypothetical protein